MFNEKDQNYIKAWGSEVRNVDIQISCFKEGFPAVKLVGAATLERGMISLSEDESFSNIEYYDSQVNSLDIMKFVPASGAASRMFKNLFSFLESFSGETEDYEEYYSDQSFGSVFHFIDNLENFAFVNQLSEVMERAGESLENSLLAKRFDRIIFYLLDSEKGLGYEKKPKGLLLFHAYPDEANRMAVAEHLVEGALYAKGKNSIVKIHFTVSPEHEVDFKNAVKELVSDYEKRFQVKFEISFSNQKSSTDTIAVTLENEPFRNNDGSLLFRPAGHGALIHNLNDLDEDLIFIKNIDNVVPDRLKDKTVTSKKALAGFLLKRKSQINNFCKDLTTDVLTENGIENIANFVSDKLMISLPEKYFNEDIKGKSKILFEILNRPFRICGMVRNEGEPGGGPYFVEDAAGKKSLQIVESSQMNLNDFEQKKIVESATHFNPVDLFCALRDYKGEKFDLTKFVDPTTGFISTKSKDGKSLKALELPGLWNGAMADWITLFVEVPIITFNPVKSVNDLLRAEHQ